MFQRVSDAMTVCYVALAYRNSRVVPFLFSVDNAQTSVYVWSIGALLHRRFIGGNGFSNVSLFFEFCAVGAGLWRCVSVVFSKLIDVCIFSV